MDPKTKKMSERKEQIIQIVKMLIVVICASLYAMGGTEGMGGKWLRRFMAPAICGGTAVIITRDWLSLVKMPVLIIASHLGYGADSTVMKVFKRFYCGIAFGLGATLYEAIRGRWALVMVIGVMVVWAFVTMGVINPFNSARIEESILGLIIYSSAIMPLKRRSI